MQINQALGKACGIAMLGLCSFNGYAASITGQVNTTGTVAVSAFTIDFYSGVGSACGTPSPLTTGCFGTSNPISNDFNTLLLAPGLGYQAGNTIKDLFGGPISGPVVPTLLQFMTFHNGITFDLTKVPAGVGVPCPAAPAPAITNAPGYSCTPMIGAQTSPFTLVNSPGGANGIATNAGVFFNVELTAYSGLASTGTSSYNGAFSTQTAGQNITVILSEIAAGRSVEASYSASFNGTPNNPIPEPGTLGTIGIGLAALILGSIRRKTASIS